MFTLILSNLWNKVHHKEILYDMGGCFSMSVKDIPGPRKECRGVKRGPAVPIADMR